MSIILTRYTIKVFYRSNTGKPGNKYLIKLLEIDVNALERSAIVRPIKKDLLPLSGWHERKMLDAVTHLKNDNPNAALATLLEAWPEVRLTVP